MTLQQYKDESHRLTGFMKSRFGFIVDSISGVKLDVLVDCADFCLLEAKTGLNNSLTGSSLQNNSKFSANHFHKASHFAALTVDQQRMMAA